MSLRMNIVSTDEVTTIDGVPVRAWIGTTQKGTECIVYVRAVVVETEADNGKFERELLEIAPVVISNVD